MATMMKNSRTASSNGIARGKAPKKSSNVGAVAIGAGLGLALALGRKIMVQAVSGASGDWMAALKIEHKLAAGIMDKMAETGNTETVKRNMLLAALKHALGKHAFQEENVIYPALREVHEEAEADELNDDHGYIKTYLYRLEMMPKDSPEWLNILADFRALLDKHVREEEDEIYPPFHQKMTAEQNRKLTLTMNKEGFKLA